jgi:hypothetical protein
MFWPNLEPASDDTSMRELRTDVDVRVGSGTEERGADRQVHVPLDRDALQAPTESPLSRPSEYEGPLRRPARPGREPGSLTPLAQAGPGVAWREVEPRRGQRGAPPRPDRCHGGRRMRWKAADW